MATRKCPACGKKAEGNFCSWCGATLGDAECAKCGAEVDPGARFCSNCGAPTGASGSGGGVADTASAGARSGKRRGGGASGPGKASPVVWGVAAVFMIGLILAVALPAVRSAEESVSQPAAPMGGTGGAPAAGGAPSAADVASMPPREAADRLYTRIMTAAEAEDSATVSFFLPMGMQAYDRARPLDADGLFHLSLLQRMADDPEAGLETAREALTVAPTHLLNLASAGGAALEMGDTATAREYYETFLEAYDDEMAKGLEEYQLHSGMMPELLEDAREITGG